MRWSDGRRPIRSPALRCCLCSFSDARLTRTRRVLVHNQPNAICSSSSTRNGDPEEFGGGELTPPRTGIPTLLSWIDKRSSRKQDTPDRDAYAASDDRLVSRPLHAERAPLPMAATTPGPDIVRRASSEHELDPLHLYSLSTGGHPQWGAWHWSPAWAPLRGRPRVCAEPQTRLHSPPTGLLVFLMIVWATLGHKIASRWGGGGCTSRGDRRRQQHKACTTLHSTSQPTFPHINHPPSFSARGTLARLWRRASWA